MGLSGRLVFGGMAAGVALAYYIRKRHVEHGEAYVDVIKQLPATARRSVEDVRRRAAQALEEGKVAARLRDEELGRQLKGLQAPTVTSFSSEEDR
jgi:predicted lipase